MRCYQKPYRTKGISKIYLHPGEEKEVILELDERSFSVYDVEKKLFPC
ncbi:MAG: fibronectin type III-like domain-contianing protein [Gallintestinimicrobium sp.]